MKHAVFTFCVDPDKDPVASHVFAALQAEIQLDVGDIQVDGYPVLQLRNSVNSLLSVVRTRDVIGHDYTHYADIINNYFGSADVVGVVNWHQGANAPNSIFTIQTSGDLSSGTFSPVDPRITRSLLLAVEDERLTVGLSTFQTLIEATHWSGTQYGQSGRLVADLKPSCIDIEIGSQPSDWGNSTAAQVIARALPRVFDRADEQVLSLLCFGGVHFEPSFTAAAFSAHNGSPLAIAHVLPNHWLVSEGYDQPSRDGDLLACAASVTGGVDAVIFHDKLKASFKEAARRLAAKLGVAAYSHKKLKQPDEIFLERGLV